MKNLIWQRAVVSAAILGLVACSSNRELSPQGDPQQSGVAPAGTSQAAAPAKTAGLRQKALLNPNELTVPHVPNELLITAKRGVTLAQLQAQPGVLAVRPLWARYDDKAPDAVKAGWPDVAFVFKVTLDVDHGTTLDQHLEHLANAGLAEVVEHNNLLQPYATPNDPQVGGQPWQQTLGLNGLWDTTTGSKNVVVAVLDTGVEWTHPDLAANIWSNTDEIAGNGIDDDHNGKVDDVRGWDFIDVPANVVAPGEDPGPPDNDPMDKWGHGTHVAGIIGAVGNNGVGVAGVNWNVSLMALRCGYLPGGMPGSAVFEAITYAVDNGAQIINMSFGGPAPDLSFRSALLYAASHNVLLVAAAGNDGQNHANYPSAFPEVLSVGSIDSDSRVASDTTYGSYIDVMAPGVSILSTYTDASYTTLSGTSMASPMVAGIAALIKARNPSFTAAQLRDRILASAQPIFTTSPLYAGQLGAGKVSPTNLFSTTFQAQPLANNVQAVEQTGDGDDRFEPGEQVKLSISAKSMGATSTITGTLSSSDPFVTVTQGTQSFGALASRSVASRDFVVSVAANVPADYTANLSLSLSTGQRTETRPVALKLNEKFARVSLSNKFSADARIFDVNGTAVAIFRQINGNSGMYSATRAPNNDWTSPIDLGVFGDSFRVDAVQASNRDVHFVQTLTPPTGPHEIRYRRYDAATQSWTASVLAVSNADFGRTERIGIAVDAASRPNIVWFDGNNNVKLADLNSGGTWNAPITIGSFDPNSTFTHEGYVSIVNGVKSVFVDSGLGQFRIQNSGSGWGAVTQLSSGNVHVQGAPLVVGGQVTRLGVDLGTGDLRLLALSGTSWVTSRTIATGLTTPVQWGFNGSLTSDGKLNVAGVQQLLTTYPNPALMYLEQAGGSFEKHSVEQLDASYFHLFPARTSVSGPVLLTGDRAAGYRNSVGIDVLSSSDLSNVMPLRPGVAIVAHSASSLDFSINSSEYEFAVGRNPGASDTVNWTAGFSSSSQHYTLPDGVLLPGQTYFLSARNKHGYYSGPLGVSAPLTMEAGPIGVALPARIEAESYVRFFDSDPTNNGASGSPQCNNRADAVDQWNNSDNGGVCHIGWAVAGEWLEYDVSVATAASFDITLRVASALTGKQARVVIDGAPVGTITAPNAGWGVFQDRVISNIAIAAGSHVLRLEQVTGDIDLNYINVQTSSSSGPRVAVPARIEAESYVRFVENDPTNQGAAGSPQCNRNDGVDIEATSDQGGVCSIGWTAPGEALEYDISVATAGNYDITTRLASATNNRTLRLRIDSVDMGLVLAPNLGWASFQDRTVYGVPLSAGNHTIRVEMVTGDLNLNYLDIKASQAQGFTQRTEAEDYTAFSEADPTNQGGGCDRADGVDKIATSDRNGNCKVGWTNAGESLSYAISVPQTASYQLMLRVGSALSGKTVKAYIDNVAISGALSVTQQAAWDVYQDLGITTSLSAGPHTLKVEFVTGSVDFNYFTLTQVSAAPVRVRAWQYWTFNESDTANNGAAGSPQCDRKDGVDFETTSDGGAGCDLGWTAPGEWVEYKVTDTRLAGTGPWSFTVRAASGAAGGSLAISVDGGSAVNYSVANQGWQAFQNIAVSVPGVSSSIAVHTVRVTFPNGAVNLNYLDF